MTRNRIIIVGVAALVLLIAACAGSYFFWPRARDWTDEQYDNIVNHHDNASRMLAGNDFMRNSTIRHWVDECDKSMSTVGLCFSAFDNYNLAHTTAQMLVSGREHCHDEPGYPPENARRHIRNYVAWFKAHKGYYGITAFDAFQTVTPVFSENCYVDPPPPAHPS